MTARWWIGCAALLAACGGDDDPSLARRAEEVRELRFLEPVEFIEMTREEYAAQAEAQAAQITDEDLDELAQSWGRLGYFPLDADLRPIIAGSSSDWVGGYYSPAEKSIVLVGQAADSTLVHEYVHALQDQHFGIGAYDGDTSDAFLARRAVVEGDAVLAEGRYVLQEEFDVGLESANWGPYLEQGRESSLDFLVGASYPVFFLDYPSFVYTYGLEYCAANLVGVTIDDPAPDPPPYNWGREDELFTDRPPATVQQVLRRDLDVDAVEDVGLMDVPASLAGRLEAIDWDRLGEWYIYLLFYPLEGSPELPDARGLAAGWDGDRVLFVRDLEGGAVATVWVSAWDDEATAGAALGALAALYGRSPGPPELGAGRDGEMVWLEQLGNRVVAIKNLDPELAPMLADEAFAPSPSRRAARARPPLGLRLRGGRLPSPGPALR